MLGTLAASNVFAGSGSGSSSASSSGAVDGSDDDPHALTLGAK